MVFVVVKVELELLWDDGDVLVVFEVMVGFVEDFFSVEEVLVGGFMVFDEFKRMIVLIDVKEGFLKGFFCF